MVWAGYGHGTGIAVGTGEGYTGYYPPTDLLLGEQCCDSEAGPVRPCKGLEWVVTVLRANRRLDGPRYHPSGARSVLRPSLYLGPRNAASWPIWRDSMTFLIKLVKTA